MTEVPRNQFIDLLCKSIDWFLYDRDLHHERSKVNNKSKETAITFSFSNKNIVIFGFM